MDADDTPVRRWRLVAQAMAGVAGGMGALDLFGWATGSLAPREAMPPDAGFLFIASASALIGFLRKPKWARPLAVTLAVMTLLVSGNALFRQVEIPGIVAPAGDAPGEPLAVVPLPCMGFTAALSFLMVALGLLWLAAAPRHRRLTEALASFCGITTAVCGLAHILGRVYGSPLHYERGGLPITLASSIAFALLGFALALAPVIQDFATRRLERRRQSAQNAATRTLIEAENLADAGARLLAEICVALGWSHGALWVRDASRGLLRCTSAWTSLAIAGGEKLTAASHAGAFARGIGLAGRAWAAGDLAVIETASEDSEFARQAAAHNAGLAGGFAAPVIANAGEVVGVLEFLYPEIGPPSRETRSMIKAIATQIGLFLRRKQAEQALGEEHNRLRAVIDNLPDHIVLKDTTGHYVLDNVAHLRSLGMTSTSQLIGKTVKDLFPPEEAAQFEADDEFVFGTGKPIFNKEEYRIGADGTPRWASTSKLPFHDEAGKVIGLIYVSRDITERKEAEEALQAAQMQLIQAEKLESLGRLAAGIAHEVKNPLAMILMGADFLEGELGDRQITGPPAEVIGQIREAAWRADRIIRGMLDFSAPKKMHFRAVSLNELVRDSLPLIRHEVDSAHLDLKTELDPGAPPVNLDTSKIQQVFINICTNAIHAMTSGGTLTVRTLTRILKPAEAPARDAGSRVNERLRTGDRVVVLEIDDTGAGIPPEKMQYIFEPFYTTKPTGKGTGLGLSVTRKIIELHGGDIRIANRSEGGVRVTILLRPLAVADRAPAAALAGTPLESHAAAARA